MAGEIAALIRATSPGEKARCARGGDLLAQQFVLHAAWRPGLNRIIFGTVLEPGKAPLAPLLRSIGFNSNLA